MSDNQRTDWQTILIYGGLAVAGTWGTAVLTGNPWVLAVLFVVAGVTMHALGYAFGHDAGRVTGDVEGFKRGYRCALDLVDRRAPNIFEPKKPEDPTC